MQIEENVTIQRPLDEVFAYVSNAEHDAEWRTNVKEIRRLSGDGGAGTIYKQTLKGPMGKDLPADLQYTDYQHNRRLAFDTIEGSVRPSATIEFAPAGDNATHIRFVMIWEPTGGAKVASKIIGKFLEKNVRESYANLVRHMESRPVHA
jgi:uncharacterized membrane protein